MPMRCSADRRLAAALALGLAACSGAASSAPQSAPTTAAGLALAIDGRQLRVPVALDAAAIDPAGDHDTRLLARTGGLAIVLDSYASQPQSMSRCQAGQERWLRVIDIAAARERYAKRVESCLADIVAGDPLFTGPDAAGAYTVHLVSEPSLRIAADGSVEAVP